MGEGGPKNGAYIIRVSLAQRLYLCVLFIARDFVISLKSPGAIPGLYYRRFLVRPAGAQTEASLRSRPRPCRKVRADRAAHRAGTSLRSDTTPCAAVEQNAPSGLLPLVGPGPCGEQDRGGSGGPSNWPLLQESQFPLVLPAIGCQRRKTPCAICFAGSGGPDSCFMFSAWRGAPPDHHPAPARARRSAVPFRRRWPTATGWCRSWRTMLEVSARLTREQEDKGIPGANMEAHSAGTSPD